MNIEVIGSSSSGNCTVLWEAGSTLMIDCGFGPALTEKKLNARGLSLETLSALCITHIHGDHIHSSTLAELFRLGKPVYLPEKVGNALEWKSNVAQKMKRAGLLRFIQKDEPEVGPFLIKPFAVPHDSPGGCFGYNVFITEGSRIRKSTIATDLGFIPADLAGHFRDSDTIVIESNHDPAMLESSGRPRWLKDRIKRIGHLSNMQCADLVADVINRSAILPRRLILAHLSKQCNTPSLACGEVERKLHLNGITSLVPEAAPRV